MWFRLHTSGMVKFLGGKTENVHLCASQGDQRGRRQSGWCQQSAWHRLHRLTHITKHRRQWQGNTHSYCMHTMYKLGVCHSGSWPHDWLQLAGCVCGCEDVWGSFHSSSSEPFLKPSLVVCSPHEVRLIYLNISAATWLTSVAHSVECVESLELVFLLVQEY